jgi:type IV pilus assembly protein PilB
MSAEPQNVEEIASFLSHVSLFRNVKPDYLRSIAKRVEEVVFSRDQVIFNEGDAGDALYLIRAGSVGVFLVDPKMGLRFELARLRIGQVFGEMAVLTNEPRAATVKAMEPTSCIVLSRQTFYQIVERIPDVAIGVAQVLAERLTQLNKEKGASAVVDVNALAFDPEVYQMVPARILERHKMIPLNIMSGVLTVACVDATDLAGLDELRRMIRGLELKPININEADYAKFLEINRVKIGGGAVTGKQQMRRLQPVTWISEEKEASLDSKGGDDIKLLVDVIVAQAMDLEASDIHIEPELDAVNVRYRVAGALMKRPAPPINRSFARAIASRIKVLADLDISERRRPQDGRISCKVGTRPLDLRVSVMPTHEGEKIVMRLLDSANAIKPLENLVLAEKVCRVVHQMVMRPYGIVFVCGPTGSGKTTTLYSAIGVRRREDTNIVTVEDPVEYNLSGITQVSVHNEIGLTFSSVLRSFLRQDPNVILVGETRDRETGKIALEAGLTGHLVLTSLHTNDAIGTIQRLREMGLEDYAIAAALVGIVSQRLVRRLCPACAVDAPPSPHVLEQLALIEVLPRDYSGNIKRAKGCEACAGSGYRGRVGVYEILVADDDLRQAITSGANQFELRATAHRGAFVPMVRYSSYLLTNGITTAEEVLAIHAGRSARGDS